ARPGRPGRDTRWAGTARARRRRSSASVERRRQPAAVGRGQRMLLAELLEQRHHQLADALPAVTVRRLHLGEQQGEGALVVLGLERRDELWLLPALAQLGEQPLALARARQPVEEARDSLRSLDADELVHDPAVAESLDRRDAPDLVLHREL